MIAGIATLRLRIGLRLALKERTRHVVEQHLVLDCKQFSTALRQMRFEGGLVSEQMIESAVETILVDLLITELQQIAQRCATVPVLGNVQLARRRAEPRRNQNRRHLGPCNALLSNRQQPLAQILKPRSAP